MSQLPAEYMALIPQDEGGFTMILVYGGRTVQTTITPQALSWQGVKALRRTADKLLDALSVGKGSREFLTDCLFGLDMERFMENLSKAEARDMVNFDKRTPVQKILGEALMRFREHLPLDPARFERPVTAGDLTRKPGRGPYDLPVTPAQRTGQLVHQCIDEALENYGAAFLENAQSEHIKSLYHELHQWQYIQRFLDEMVQPKTSR